MTPSRMPILRSLNSTWWSFEDAILWISLGEQRSVLATLQTGYDEQPPFEMHAFLRAFRELILALLDGDLTAHASIDAKPVSAVSPPLWNSFDFIPYWDSPGTDLHFDPWPKILILSQKLYRPEALLDHSERSHLMISTAKNLNGEPGFHRVISDVTVSRADVFELWQREPATSPPNKQAKASRKKRDTTIKIEETLAMMSHNGLSLAGAPQGLPFTHIAEMLVNRWFDEGDKTIREVGSVAKSVGRYYDRRNTGQNK
jgi:hypothetical protein